MSGPRVHLHIDRLVLRGVPREQRDAVVRSLENEIARQLAQPGAHENFRPRHAPSLRTGPLTLAEGATPKQLGASAARALVRSLKG